MWLRLILNPEAMTLLQTLPTSARTASVRTRELETGRLLERATRARLEDGQGARFLVARAHADVRGLDAGSARHALARAVEALEGEAPDRGELAGALVCWGGVLEAHHELEDAVRAFEAALAARPDALDVMLHAARAHRKAGNREAARALYGQVRERGDGRLGRFSRLGEALLGDSPESALAVVIAEADAAAEREVAAVALEERARLRRAAGRTPECVADYAAAGLRYEERRDRLRVAHVLADVLLASGDTEAAREALGAALELAASAAERRHAVQRLRTLARLQGDELGLRRYPPEGPAPLVSLMPARRAAAREAESMAPALRAWRDALADG